MFKDWDSITGSLRPKGSSDVRAGLKKVIQAHGMYYDKNNDPNHEDLASEIWRLANEDPDKVIEAFDATIRKKGKVNFLLSCLQGSPQSGKRERRSIPQEVDLSAKQGETPETPPIDKSKSNFIFLYRSIRHHPWFKGKPAWVKLLFIELCLDAAWKDHEVEFKGLKYTLHRGQWLVSMRDLAREYERDPKMVRYWMEKLGKEQMIQCSTAIMQHDSKSIICSPPCSPGLSPGLSPPRSPLGVLVTICKYNEYQAEISGLSPPCSPGLSPGLSPPRSPLTEEGLKEGQTKEGLQNPPTPLTANKLLDLWNQNRGPLPQVLVYTNLEQYEELVDLFNEMGKNNGKEPEVKWIEFIQTIVARVHPTNRSYIMPSWIADKLNRVDSLLGGTYDRNFGSKGDEAAAARKRRNWGGTRRNSSEDGKEVGETSGTTLTLGRAKMQPMQRRGIDLESGKDSGTPVQVPNREMGVGSDPEKGSDKIP